MTGRDVIWLLVGAATIIVVGYWASSYGPVPDPLRDFLFAFLLVLIFNILPIVNTTITLYWKINGLWLEGDAKSDHESSLIRAPLSAAVGLVEQVLYVYCLSSTHREFIGSVLLFKAFTAWLSESSSRNISPDAGTGTENVDYTQANRIALMRFYVYAIGNFVSLAFAVLFFEVAHLSGPRFVPWLLSL